MAIRWMTRLLLACAASTSITAAHELAAEEKAAAADLEAIRARVDRIADDDDAVGGGFIRGDAFNGGGSFRIPGRYDYGYAMSVQRWKSQADNPERRSEDLNRLIDAGPAAAPVIHEKLKGMDAARSGAAPLAAALAKIGTRDSVPILIDLFARAATAIPGGLTYSGTENNVCAASAALWELSGRPHAWSPDEWTEWWNEVERDFVPLRDRRGHVVMGDHVRLLIDELETRPVLAAEHLIVMGNAAIPNLLAALEGAGKSQQDRIACVVDELGAGRSLPDDVSRAYSIHRLAEHTDDSLPIETAARVRMINQNSFSELCTIVIEADRQSAAAGKDARAWGWLKLNSQLIHRRLGAKPWQGARIGEILALADAERQLADALPVLIAGLADESLAARKAATEIADAIAQCGEFKPAPLIDALQEAWLAESDDHLRYDHAISLARFGTPDVLRLIESSLWSERLEIVGDAAGMVDWGNLRPARHPRAFDRLEELTRHDDRRVRYMSVRALRYQDDKRLLPHLERLAGGGDDAISRECIFVMRQHPAAEHAPLLFKLAESGDEQLRIAAIDALGDPAHRESLPRLVPFLRDKQVYGYAVSAMAEAGGKDALPLFMRELKAGNDVGGMVYQHLTRITGQPHGDNRQAWLDWWASQ